MRILAALGLAITALADLLLLEVVTTSCPEAMGLPVLIAVGVTMTLPPILFGGRR